jgi:hypothetical protein
MAKSSSRGGGAASTAPAKPPKPKRTHPRIEDRIPIMTDEDLQTLRTNAGRLAVSGVEAQKADAQRLLPLITAEVETRATARAKALNDKRTALREAKVKPRR